MTIPVAVVALIKSLGAPGQSHQNFLTAISWHQCFLSSRYRGVTYSLPPYLAFILCEPLYMDLSISPARTDATTLLLTVAITTDRLSKNDQK
jgi:hypothetical protein